MRSVESIGDPRAGNEAREEVIVCVSNDATTNNECLLLPRIHVAVGETISFCHLHYYIPHALFSSSQIHSFILFQKISSSTFGLLVTIFTFFFFFQFLKIKLSRTEFFFFSFLLIM